MSDRFFKPLGEDLAVSIYIGRDRIFPAEGYVDPAKADDLYQVRDKRSLIFTSPGRQPPLGPHIHN